MTASLRDDYGFGDPFSGRRLRYADFGYNETLVNERAVELPIALEWIADRRFGSRGLEVGNVLRHYPSPFRRDPYPWTTIDLTEPGPDVINIDVMDTPDLVGPAAPPFDWIVSISTIEHVGWDYEPQEPDKAVAAIDVLRSCLTPHGRALITVPTGYNRHLDAAIPDLDIIGSAFFVRRGDTDATSWDRVPFTPVPYRWDIPSAGGVWVGVFGAL